jgi:NhaA family Na+:H+ antiporter
MALRPIERFLQLESASGIILFIMAVLAILWANSPLAFIHERFVNALLFVTNDGLMAVFFVAVGLELKRGFLEGQLSHYSQIILPLMAAVGGMMMPALLYLCINRQSPATIQGWATPVATDIAFALGVLSLFGKRVPSALKMFLLALAIFDDLGAIIIIGLFYTSGIAFQYLVLSAVVILALLFLNYRSVQSLKPYLVLGVLLWLCILKAGIHPTIAGVLFALTVPDIPLTQRSPLNRLENALHPWVAYLIMPLFALTDAGFSLHELSLENMSSVVVAGIVWGLFAGKQIGVFGFSWVLIKLGVAKLPRNASWLSFYGVAVLCGIGFTMSLFLGTLSFQNDHTYLAEVRLGVMIASILSGLVGAIILLVAFIKDGTNVHDGGIIVD